MKLIRLASLISCCTILLCSVSCTKSSSNTQATAATPKAVDKNETEFTGVTLPEMMNTGPIDPVYNEGDIIAIAPLGNFPTFDALKNSPFYKLLCVYYPDLAAIDHIEVDTGQGDIYLVKPRSENISFAVNEYTQAMFLGKQDESKAHVYFRTENLRPILIRMSIDDPGTVRIIGVDYNKNELNWVPTKEPLTGTMREHKGVYTMSYGVSITKNDYDYVARLEDYDDGDDFEENIHNSIRLRFYDDGIVRINNLLGHYRIFHLAKSEPNTIGLGLWIEEKYGVDSYAEIISADTNAKNFVLRPKQGTLFPIGKDLTFELQH